MTRAQLLPLAAALFYAEEAQRIHASQKESCPPGLLFAGYNAGETVRCLRELVASLPDRDRTAVEQVRASLQPATNQPFPANVISFAARQPATPQSDNGDTP